MQAEQEAAREKAEAEAAEAARIKAEEEAAKAAAEAEEEAAKVAAAAEEEARLKMEVAKAEEHARLQEEAEQAGSQGKEEEKSMSAAHEARIAQIEARGQEVAKAYRHLEPAEVPGLSLACLSNPALNRRLLCLGGVASRQGVL